MTRELPPLRFDVDEADRAGDAWGFNCGPAAVCAVTGKSPEELRPHLGDFEVKKYTNPTLMYAILASLGVKWRMAPLGPQLVEDGRNPPLRCPVWARWGLVRIQWAGPWTMPGVPIRARYRHTHWVASHVDAKRTIRVFDINATCVGGWLDHKEWGLKLVPWLLGECEPKATGDWWITHSLEIQ